MVASNFKVIVVGGGPVGLTAAHALTRANIDFVVLESRPSIVIDAGASLVLLPIGMRVLGQLGLLKTLNTLSAPLGQMERYDHGGNDLGTFVFFERFKENHGSYSTVISRHDLTRVLYEALPAESQARMLPNKKVSDINKAGDGVVVTCSDGTSYEGNMIIGADGAHSVVREQMRLLALQASSHTGAALNEEKPYLTTYRALWIRFPTDMGLKPGQVQEVHGRNLGIQMFAGRDTAVTALYERMDEPTRDRSRYTKADEEALVQRWGHLTLAKGLTVKGAYDGQVEAGLVDLEEGVVKHWSWDRIVLVGDAAHKFTPSTGAGCNNGIIDVVVLINELHKIIFGEKNGAHQLDHTIPSQDQLTAAFTAYQDARFDPVTAACKTSGGATATATWKNGTLKFLDKYIFPNHLVQNLFASSGASTIAQSPVFDFIGGPEPFSGKIPWVQAIKPSSEICA